WMGRLLPRPAIAGGISAETLHSGIETPDARVLAGGTFPWTLARSQRDDSVPCSGSRFAVGRDASTMLREQASQGSLTLGDIIDCDARGRGESVTRHHSVCRVVSARRDLRDQSD